MPGWLVRAKAGWAGVFLACCLSWRVRPLWPYAFVLLVFLLALDLSSLVGATSWWRERFAGEHVGFGRRYAGFYLRDLGVAAAVLAALWIAKHRRARFFFTPGRAAAPIEPIRRLGIREGESWPTFGWIFAGVAGQALLIPTALATRPTGAVLAAAAPLVPTVLLLSAVNALTEEIYFRLSILATLHEVVGKTQALLINAVFFSLAHYLYGSPPGIAGLLLTGFLAWLLGKSILETQGLLWAWTIHFVPDVVIFASYALAWVGR